VWGCALFPLIRYFFGVRGEKSRELRNRRSQELSQAETDLEKRRRERMESMKKFEQARKHSQKSGTQD
jgi:hypothetical protein